MNLSAAILITGMLLSPAVFAQNPTINSSVPGSPLSSRFARQWSQVKGMKTTGTGLRVISEFSAYGDTSGAFAPNDSIIYTYPGPTSNNYNTATYYSWTGSAFQPDGRDSAFYNAAGNILQFREETWNGSAWTISNRGYFNYNNSGLLDTVKWELWNPTTMSWDLSSRILMTYNASGKQVLRIDQTWNTITGSWANSQRQSWTYDGNGNQLTWIWESWTVATSSWHHLVQSVSHYDASNRLISVVHLSDPNNTNWTNSDSLAYTAFNAAGKPLSSITFRWNTNSWDKDVRQTFTYTTSGLLNYRLIERWNNNAWVNDQRSFNNFNTSDQFTDGHSDSWINGGWGTGPNDFLSRYHYESFTTRVTGIAEGKSEVLLYPVPADHFLEVATQETDSRPTTAAIYDGTGRLHKLEMLTAGEHHLRFRLDTLPSGLYQLRLTGAEGTISRTFLVQH